MTEMSPLRLRVLTEHYEKEGRNFQLVESYRPNAKRAAVTSKFYARHDASDLSAAKDEFLNVISYEKQILRLKMNKPDSVNHSYGWYSEPLVKRNVSDKRLNHPLVSNENTKHMVKLAADRSLARPKFTGIPFKF